MTLTKRQKEILEHIQGFMDRHGYSPSIEEIGAHFGFASPNAAFKHLKALERRGYIRRLTHSARSIELVRPAEPAAVALPLLGAIAAGTPIEALETVETVLVPADFTGRGAHFVLRVRGQSMIEEHIEDGDLVIVREAEAAANGEMVVALVDGEERHPEGASTARPDPPPAGNPAMAPLVVPEAGAGAGRGGGVMRKYR